MNAAASRFAAGQQTIERGGAVELVERFEDLLQAGRVAAAGYVNGVGPCTAAAPKRNLTGDPYHTDGNRAVVLLSAARTSSAELMSS